MDALVKTGKLLCLALTVTAVACDSRPDGVLSHDEMVALMVDIHKGESMVESNQRSFPTDSTRQAFKQSLYARHGLTTAQADSTFAWYGYHMEEYIEVCDDVIKRLEAELATAQATAGASSSGLGNIAVSVEGDSVDVWPGIRFRDFGANTPSDIITFAAEPDANWEKGDVYTLRFKRIDGGLPLDVSLGAEYLDNKREFISSKASGDGWHEFRLVTDPDHQPRSVHGYILVPSGRVIAGSVDSLSLTRERWNEKFRYLRSSDMVEFTRSTKKSGQ